MYIYLSSCLSINSNSVNCKYTPPRDLNWRSTIEAHFWRYIFTVDRISIYTGRKARFCQCHLRGGGWGTTFPLRGSKLPLSGEERHDSSFAGLKILVWGEGRHPNKPSVCTSIFRSLKGEGVGAGGTIPSYLQYLMKCNVNK